MELQPIGPLYGNPSMIREGTTDESGLYSLRYEGVSRIYEYRLHFEKKGFKTWVHSGSGSSVVVVDVRLALE